MVEGSVVWDASHCVAKRWSVIRPADGSTYGPRVMSAAIWLNHASASRFCRSRNDLLRSVPSGPMYRAR